MTVMGGGFLVRGRDNNTERICGIERKLGNWLRSHQEGLPGGLGGWLSGLSPIQTEETK